MSDLSNLMRKIDRKLDIHRGMNFSFEELGLLVSTGAYAQLQAAVRKHREEECHKPQKHTGPRLVG
jgi:hypothetical protein